MIPRYSPPDMAALFSDQARFAMWLEVELLATEAQAALGNVPADEAATCRAKAPTVDDVFVADVLEREKVTDHDVAAFVDVVQERIGAPAGSHIHYGLTSSDVVDTALCATLTKAADVLLADLDAFVAVLKARALELLRVPVTGRTHGMHAEPTTFGAKYALWALQADRDRRRMKAAREAIAVGKLSGAVGTYSNIDPAVEARVMGELGLRPADVATQVVFRDGIAEWVSALAILATACEAIALEIRHGQRTEVAELMEPFSAGQKGSSAMPHKRNPIRSERICGLARVVRGYITPVMEGMALWHERDISHSSVERVALPDAAIATDYLVHLTTGVIEGLAVYPARMRANLDSTGGLIYTSSVLLELVRAGMSREDAYAIVQAAAMAAWDTGANFREALRKEATAAGQPLDEARLDEVCRPERYVERLGPVFARLQNLT